ncbi:MAG: NUDIX domain-containing protein [Parcubacteria group bacterium]|jgi:isopentenyl-diphosphate delta-isomerase|nr:NUDIX domain-containing protein [Candidatus Moranbacteria bacterium]MDX9855251.1 NUDIX domain-containing protein [Candidatus Moranbacteria bacterium]
MANDKIIIVNEKDEVIGSDFRKNVGKGKIYRVSALWVENSQGDALLAQRAFTKSHSPGKWGPTVAGTNDEGENYDDNIIKEAEEEIGIKGLKFEKDVKIRVSGKYDYFCQWYKLIIDRDLSEFKVDKKEIEQIKWFSKKELRKSIESSPEMFVEALGEFIIKSIS